MKIAKIGLALLVGGAAIGWKFYSKGESHDETKAELISLCTGDNECVAAVNQHFDHCHEQAFSLGGRRESAHLDGQALVSCINGAAGKELFTAQ